jgi:transcriptional regulator with XRE-family HTH domain
MVSMFTRTVLMDETYGRFMRAARERKGLTQEQLATQLDGVPGCKQANLSEMERGKTIPNRVQEDLIAEALEMSKEDRDRWSELIRIGESASMRRKSEAAHAARGRDDDTTPDGAAPLEAP